MDTHCLVDRHKGECQVATRRADSLVPPRNGVGPINSLPFSISQTCLGTIEVRDACDSNTTIAPLSLQILIPHFSLPYTSQTLLSSILMLNLVFRPDCASSSLCFVHRLSSDDSGRAISSRWKNVSSCHVHPKILTLFRALSPTLTARRAGTTGQYAKTNGLFLIQLSASSVIVFHSTCRSLPISFQQVYISTSNFS